MNAVAKLLKSSPIEIRTDEWACTESEKRVSKTYVKAGAAWVPVTTEKDYCTQWRLKP